MHPRGKMHPLLFSVLEEFSGEKIIEIGSLTLLNHARKI